MAEKGTSQESVVRDFKRRIRRAFNVDEKIRIVLDGLKGEESIVSFSLKTGPLVSRKFVSLYQVKPIRT